MYFQMDWLRAQDNSLAHTDSAPDVGVPWTMGRKYTDPVPQPLVCTLDPDGGTMRDMFLTDIPLFSDRMIAALREIGIDNFDTYEAELHGADGRIHKDYKAVLILGLVSCANMEKSEYLPQSKPPLVRFQRLVIDEPRARGVELFRLAEDAGRILVSERVHQKLLEIGVVGISFTPVESSG